MSKTTNQAKVECLKIYLRNFAKDNPKPIVSLINTDESTGVKSREEILLIKNSTGHGRIK